MISNRAKVPGLVDLQVNGYKGINFSDMNLTQESFVLACRGVFEAGTTAFLPTMVTSPAEVYEHNRRQCCKAKSFAVGCWAYTLRGLSSRHKTEHEEDMIRSG
ncbi:MAG: hypothetical protein ACYSYV_02805 [Planctomycetota bacterium]